jgi:hypothetical protein
MSDWFDQPASNPTTREPSVVAPSTGKPWLTWGLAAIALFFAVLWVGSKFDGDGSNDDKQIKVKGTHVLVIEKDGGRGELTEDQMNIILGTAPKDWYKQNDVQWRLFAESDSVDKLDFWGEFKESLTLSPPAAIVTNGKKTIQFKLPKDWESMKSKIEPLITR